MGRKSQARVTNTLPSGLPQYCDYSCQHASFAPVETVGACRKELAVYCILVKRYNNKNSRCIANETSSAWNR